jgi:hypothetical protein
MTNILKKAAKLYRTASYCMARAEVYLDEANRTNEK